MLLIASAVGGVFALLVLVGWMGARIDNQQERNTYLQTEIKQLDVRIAKIKDLEKVREHLLARKQIIEQLQADRSQMVHLFDELVKTIPTSARLSGLKQSGQSMSLDGVAQSNASVAEYMRNVESSPWMGHTDLRKTENTHDATRMPYSFGLDVTLSRPKTDEADAGKEPVQPAEVGSSAAPASAAPATSGTAAKATTVAPAKPADAPAKRVVPEAKPVSAPATVGAKP